ncbi:MAG: type II toxin-antitoxin system Phd/YefM family antitoxin [Actinomycetales bacterium]|nr:type II toxin-antitoxin system Phd/YefM family antitoxin [Actinomycetales bacterium]
MDEILTRLTTTISAFKANPNREVKAAGNEPFCVLTNNRPSFYVLSPERYDELAELLWEIENKDRILQAMEEAKDPKNLIEVNIDDLLAGKFPDDLGDE